MLLACLSKLKSGIFILCKISLLPLEVVTVSGRLVATTEMLSREISVTKVHSHHIVIIGFVKLNHETCIAGENSMSPSRVPFHGNHTGFSQSVNFTLIHQAGHIYNIDV